jgi:hypothetical protein
MRWFGPNLLDGSQRLNASCPLLASSLTIAAAKNIFWKLEHNLTKRHPQVLSQALPKFATDFPAPCRRRGGTRLTRSPVLWNYFGNYQVFGY